MISSYSQKLSVWAGLLAILVLVTGTASGAVPYYETLADKSGSLTDYNSITNLGGSITFTATGVLGLGDDDGLQLNGASGLVVGAGDGSEDNVFCQLYIKPVPFNAPPDPGDAFTAIYIGEEAVSNLHVYSGSEWVVPSLIPTIDTNKWLGVAVHLDYSLSVFDIYVALDGAYTNEMLRANDQPLPMSSSYAGSGGFESMTVSNSSASTAYMDVPAVATSPRACLAAHTNLTIELREAGEIRMITTPPYQYAGSDGAFGDIMGLDLAISIASGAEIQMINVDDWNTFTLQPSGAWLATLGTYTLATEINPAQPLILVNGGTDDALAFYPHSAVPTPAISITAVQGDAVLGDRTPMALPSFEAGCVQLNGATKLGFVGLLDGDNAGDEIRFYDEATGVSVNFRWDGSSWYDGATEVTDFEVCPGDTWLYYNRSTGDIIWTGL